MYIKKPLYEHEFKEFLQKGRHSFEGEIFDFDVKKQIFDFINSSDIDNKLDFSGAEFKESVDLSYMKFHTNPTFKGAKFKKEANFTETKFLGKGEVSFEGVEFSDKVNFTKSQLGDANFTKSNFLKCNPKRSNSPSGANSKGSNSLSGACFQEVRFGSANFFEAEFSVRASFHKAIFKKNTKFEKTKFKEEVSFEGVEFSDKADFIEAQFEKKNNLSSIEFLIRPKFENATFNGEVKIDAIIYGESKDRDEVVKETGLPKKHGEGIKVFKGKKTVFQKEFKEKIKNGKGFFKNRHFDFDIGQHLKGEYKSGVDLKFNFADTEFSEKINCEGIAFKKEVIFENTIFKKEVNFSKVEFEESVGFSKAEFKEKADFNETKFKSKVVFYKAIFKNTAVFTEAKFSGLENPELEKDQKVALIKEFKELEKDQKVDLIKKCQELEKDQKVALIKEFKELEKDQRAPLMEEFQEKIIDIYLKNIRKEELNRYIPEIFRKLDGVSFEQATFKGEARFKEAKFLSKANFYKAEFLDTANFNTAIFKDEIHFGHANFESIVHFSNAQLLKDTDFTFAVFKGLTTFRETKFEKKLSFYKTKFADHVNFNESQFKDCYKEEKEEAVFGKTEFSKELDFENIIIEGDNPLIFNSVIFSRRYLTDFCEIDVKKKEKKTEEIYAEKPTSLIFEDISFPSEVVFSRCDLAKTEFLDCIIEKARFLNCDFSKTGHFPFNRDSFYFKEKEEKEENKPNKKNIWDKIETYLKLLKSYFKFSLVWLVFLQILLLFFPKIIEMWLSPYTIIITIVGIFFSLIHLLCLEKRIVKLNSWLVVFGALFSARILLSYFPYTNFGNITIGFPFSIIAFIVFFSVAICRKWQEKKPKKKPDRQDKGRQDYKLLVKGRVKFSFLVLVLVLVLILVVGVLYYAGMLLSYLPDIFFGNSLPFSIILDIIVVLFFLGVFRLSLKNQKEEQDRQDKEQLSRQMKSSLEASKSWKQAGDFYIGELELRRQNWLSYCGLSIYKYYLGYAERFTVILFWIFALFFYTTGFNYNKNLDYFKEIRNPTISIKIGDIECKGEPVEGKKMFTEKCITKLVKKTGYSEECIKATNNSVFIRRCFLDSIKKSANLLIFPLTLRTQTKGFETLSDVAFVMLSWPVWLAFFIAIKRRFRF